MLEDVDRRKLSVDFDGEEQRNLGGYVPPFPDDLAIDIAINGKIITTWDKTMVDKLKVEIAYNEAFYPLLDDENITGDVELALRTRSEADPKAAGWTVTHVYWS